MYDSQGNDSFCPNCGSSSSGFFEDYVRGDTICGSCGLCLPERLMEGRLSFADSNHHITVDPYWDFQHSSTIIGGTGGRLNRMQDRMEGQASIAHKNLVVGFGHIRAFGAMFDLQKIVMDTAKHLLFEYFKRSSAFASHSRSEKKSKCPNVGSESFVLSVCYCAMESHCCGKTIREITAFSDIEEQELRTCLKRLRKVIPDLLQSHSSEENPKIQGFVRSIVQQLSLSFSVETLATEIAQQAMDALYEEIGGKRPSTIAVACVFLAAQQLGFEVDPENIALCAAVSKARMMTIASSIEANISK